MEFIPVSNSVLTEADWQAAHDALDKHWLTAGPIAHKFERALAEYFGRRDAIFVNSGSSANLLALTALELPKGSEVITCACAFPTTINPIIQNGLVPVFVDADKTYNIDVSRLEEAYTERTKAVMVAHMLGNPFDLMAVSAFCVRHNLYLIEDTCDAAGGYYTGTKLGTWGDCSTLSFFPAHQITTGEGGAILTDDMQFAKRIRSYRDWGRDCWCEPGHDNTCGRRFGGEYDHKYTYSRIGYNLKNTDIAAAIGLSQLGKLDEFVARRQANFDFLYSGLSGSKYVLPIATPDSRPSWFGFAIGTENRQDLSRYLDDNKIGNRPLFCGNVLRHPAYREIVFRLVGSLDKSNWIMDHVLWVGCWPGLTFAQLERVIECLRKY